MANKYTYEDFEREMQLSGLADQFSDADKKLAQQNPDAGMSILSYKNAYKNATTDEERARANKGAESVRSSYGNYTGGKTGGAYYMEPLSPSDYTYEKAPEYQSKYDSTIDSLMAKKAQRGTYSYGATKPSYVNRYDDQIQTLLGQITGRKEFSYDPDTDPLYSSYAKQYNREGARASAAAMANAAAASGGIPSSYAATAAAQAGNYYAAQLADKVPELYQAAYNKYRNEHAMKLSDLAAVQSAEQSDYDKYRTDLSQYNTDRSFDYGVWHDAQQMDSDDIRLAAELETLAYNKYLAQLDQYNKDRSFSYGQHMDEINSQTAERAEALKRALAAAEFSDYTWLNEMGVDTSRNRDDWERGMAEEEAKWGREQDLWERDFRNRELASLGSYRYGELGIRQGQLGVNQGQLALAQQRFNWEQSKPTSSGESISAQVNMYHKLWEDGIIKENELNEKLKALGVL